MKEQKFQQAKENVFALIKDEENKVNICLGGYAVSGKKFDTFEQANKYIATKPYELIINICSVIFTKYKKYETKNENKENK